MSTRKESTCKQCGGGIIWARLEGSDRWIPLDVTERTAGEFVLMGWDDPPVATRPTRNDDELARAPGHARHKCSRAS